MPPMLHGFPSTAGLEDMVWAPVLFRPIMGSKEQFVIGVAAASSNEFCLIRANKLEKIKCFYESDSDFVISLMISALDLLELELNSRGEAALIHFSPSLSGVFLGDIAKAKGPSCQAVAGAWMTAMSSLYTTEELATGRDLISAHVLEAPKKVMTDHLPRDVLNYVKVQRPALVDFFSEAVKNKKSRNKRSGVNVDYSSSRIVINFCTFSVKRFSISAQNVKTRLWDLSASRDSEGELLAAREHQIILKCPVSDDPEMSPRQAAELTEAVDDFRHQSSAKRLGVIPLHTVEEIGQYLLEREKAA